jgi:hypothetical protein
MKLTKFGMIVQTAGIAQKAGDSESFLTKVLDCLKRYASGDWGDLCEEDIQANESAIEYGDRVLGAYETEEGKLYIITEADRSLTTVLFADEY